MRIRHHFGLALVWFLAGAVLSSPVQNLPEGTMRDQIVTNTERLSNLERQLRDAQVNMNTANLLAIKVGVMDNQIETQAKEIDSLRSIVYGALTLATTSLVGMLGFLLRSWFSWLGDQRTRKYGD